MATSKQCKGSCTYVKPLEQFAKDDDVCKKCRGLLDAIRDMEREEEKERIDAQERRNAEILAARDAALPQRDPAAVAALPEDVKQQLAKLGKVPLGAMRVDPSQATHLPEFDQTLEYTAALRFGTSSFLLNRELALLMREEFPEGTQHLPVIHMSPEDAVVVVPNLACAATGYIHPGIRLQLAQRGFSAQSIEQVANFFKDAAKGSLETLPDLQQTVWKGSMPAAASVPCYEGITGVRLVVPPGIIQFEFYVQALGRLLPFLLLRVIRPKHGADTGEGPADKRNCLEYYFSIEGNSYVLYFRWTSLETDYQSGAILYPHRPWSLNADAEGTARVAGMRNLLTSGRAENTNEEEEEEEDEDDEEDRIPLSALLATIQKH